MTNRDEPVDNSETLWQPADQSTTDNTPQVKPRPAKLTQKRKAFIKQFVDNPKTTITQAAVAAGYSEKTAYSIGSELLKKPEIQSELAKYEHTAEMTIIEVMGYSKELGKTGNSAGASYANVAGSLANSLIDRLRGKATQRTETLSSSVNLNLNLSDIVDTTPVKPEQ